MWSNLENNPHCYLSIFKLFNHSQEHQIQLVIEDLTGAAFQLS
jgi:hypothetical protein